MTGVGRATGRRTFGELARTGRRGRHGLVWASWSPADDGDALVAFAVGRGIGGAVVRNRVRRRLRSALHQLAPTLSPGIYLFGVRPGAATASYQELQNDVTTTLRQLGALRPSAP